MVPSKGSFKARTHPSVPLLQRDSSASCAAQRGGRRARAMRAAEFGAYGAAAAVLRVRDDAPDPGPPARGELLVRVVACSVNPKDTFVRKGRFAALSGRRFPQRPGYDFAGVVVAAGAGVRGADFKPGARVWGALSGFAGGAAAELLRVPAAWCSRAPDGVPLQDAAALPLTALTALQALLAGGLRPGGRLLVHGASGGVGSAAVQLAARHLRAGTVAATASAPRADFLRSLGATHVFDYAHGGVLAAAAAAPYDVVLDAFGNASLGRCAPLLARGGTYVTLVPSARNALDDALGRLLRALTALLPARAAVRAARLLVVRPDTEALQLLARAVEAGHLAPAVEAVYDLDDVVAAHEHVERKHTRGKVLVRVADEAVAGAATAARL